MQDLTIAVDADMAEKFMIAMLRNVGDTAIWCIRTSQKDLCKSKNAMHWEDIGNNLKILGAVNELLEYYGDKPLDLATHETEKPV